MKINPEDKYVQYIILLSNMDEDSKKRLKDDAERVYGSPWSLTIREFFALSEGDLTYIGLTKETQLNASIRQYMWAQLFNDVALQVADILKRLHVPQSDDAKRASEYMLKNGVKESVLVFIRKYFGLKNFAEAEEIPLSDYIIAKKDEYNTAIFQHAMNEIQRNKFKKK